MSFSLWLRKKKNLTSKNQSRENRAIWYHLLLIIISFFWNPKIPNIPKRWKFACQKELGKSFSKNKNLFFNFYKGNQKQYVNIFGISQSPFSIFTKEIILFSTYKCQTRKYLPFWILKMPNLKYHLHFFSYLPKKSYSFPFTNAKPESLLPFFFLKMPNLKNHFHF